MTKISEAPYNIVKYKGSLGEVDVASLSASGNIHLIGGRLTFSGGGWFTDQDSKDAKSVYSNVATTSAKRDSVYTSVNDTSAEWDSVYSFVNSDSATNNTSYNDSKFVETAGDTMTGHLEGTTAYFTSLTALSAITHVIDITVHELSGFDIDGTLTVTDRVGVGTTSPVTTLHISGADALVLPVGTTSQRGTATQGGIRYSTELATFEGYDGSSWGSLGGVIDVDQDTYITAEATTDSDNLDFWTAGTQRMIIEQSGKVGIGTTTPNEALTVVGNISATGDIYLDYSSLTFSDSAGGVANETFTRQNVIDAKSVYSYVDDTSGNWNSAYTRSNGVVTIHSDVSDAGSGKIITGTERTKLYNNHSALTATSGNWNSAYTHSTGAVTDHTDVTNAGSGKIITGTERSNLDAVYTNVSTSTADWNSVQPLIQALPRGSWMIDTPTSGERDYFSMQQDNFGGDHPYSTLNYGHTFVLPYYTTVKKVIIRTAMDATSANIGIHTNEGETSGKNKKFFSETPIANTDNYLTANESKVYTFTSDTTANTGSTLGVSISSTDKLNAVNATVVLEYDTTI